jgi:DNA-binding transcriptional ArsR family regulator
MSDKLERHAAQLSALGHPVRLRVLRYVVQAGMQGSAAGEIQAHVDLPPSTLTSRISRTLSGSHALSSSS